MKYLILFSILFLSSISFSQNNKKWKHVHENDRLKIIQSEMSVSGIVQKCYEYIDGDFVVKLKLDSEYVHLLNDFNFKKLDGLLEVEIICQHKTMFWECIDYVNDIQLPKVGDHIKIWGPYVLDKRHKWCEIHPVNKIEFLF